MAQPMLNILVADNDEADRQQIRYALKQAGLPHECTETASIGEALHLCEKRTFDCAIIDHQLPYNDGLAAITALHERLPYMAIIIASSQGDAMVATEAMKRGALDYILKDSITAELIRNISKCVVEKAALQLKAVQQLEELENFARMLVHDLKAPIRSMHGFVRIIEKDLQKDNIDIHKVIGCCQRLGNATQRMDGLIDTLHQYTKAEERVVFEPIEMRQVMEDALSNLACLIQERGACVTHDELPAVIGNVPQLIQLLQNLIGNGIKYCKAKIPSAHIAAIAQEENLWLFTVKDNGIGIPKEYYQQVFEPFRRLHGTGEYEGTGLGLATCKKIVERHGGSIWCESEEGQGTTFFFTLGGTQSDAYSKFSRIGKYAAAMNTQTTL